MESTQPETHRRLIKRYSNRKLYDTQGSRYVTLLEIGEMVRAGEEVQVIDNSTKEDKTEVTLALIISEEMKERPRGIPLTTLKSLIRYRGERLLTALRDTPIGRLMPHAEVGEAGGAPGSAEFSAPEASVPEASVPSSEAPADSAAIHSAPQASSSEPVIMPTGDGQHPPSLGALRRTLEHWHAAVEERIHAVFPDSGEVDALKAQVKTLHERLARLEQHLSEKE